MQAFAPTAHKACMLVMNFLFSMMVLRYSLIEASFCRHECRRQGPSILLLWNLGGSPSQKSQTGFLCRTTLSPELCKRAIENALAEAEKQAHTGEQWDCLPDEILHSRGLMPWQEVRRWVPLAYSAGRLAAYKSDASFGYLSELCQHVTQE